MGELLFETHDNVEHLALIERSVGIFPFGMVTASRFGRSAVEAEEEVVGGGGGRGGDGDGWVGRREWNPILCGPPGTGALVSLQPFNYRRCHAVVRLDVI